MADQKLTTEFDAIDRFSKTAQTVASQFGNIERAQDRLNKQTGQSSAPLVRYNEGIKRVNDSSTAFSQKIVHAGQSMALGFTVPIISSLAVLSQFDQSMAKLQVGDSFERTATRVGQNADEIIDALKRASHGTINETELMVSASRALTAGIGDSTEKLTALMDIARDRAQVFGLTTTEAFDRLVRGISKQEKEILDEVGILFRANDAFAAYGSAIGKSADKLTEAEKAQAFFTATIRAGEATIDRQATASDTAIDSYLKQKAAIDDLVVSIQRSLLPWLTALLSGFNALPGIVKAVSLGLFGLTLIGGPLLSAFGSVLKVGELLLALGAKTIAMGRAQSASTGEQIVLENLLAAAKTKTIAAENAGNLTIARSIVARAAISGLKSKDAALEIAVSGAISRNTSLTGLNAAAVVTRTRALMAMAAAEGINLKQTQALSLALSQQTAAARGAALGLGLLSAVLLVVTAAFVGGYFALNHFRGQAKDTGVEVDNLVKDLEALDKESSGNGIALLDAQLAIIQQRLPSIASEIARLSRDNKNVSLFGFESGGLTTNVLKDLNLINSSMDNATGVAQKYADALAKVKVPSEEVRNTTLQMAASLTAAGVPMEQINSALRPLIDLLDLTIENEQRAAYAASLLGGANEALKSSYEGLNATLKENYAVQNAALSALSTLTNLESQEELELQKLSAEQDLVIANRKLELNQFGKQQKAEEEHISALQAESDAIGKQISAIDIQIKEKELYIQTLIPPQLLQEIALLEKEVKVRQRASFYMGLHISALQREANEIQRAINATERQAEAIEKANKPLQNQISLLDIQARKLELASRPARRRLEQLQKIPGISQQVINAAQKEVDAYDDQLAALQDSVDAIQIDIDIRQLQADAIRAQSETLNDQLDLINEEIEILGDEQQAFDDTTATIEEQIEIRQDYIDTLVPPELQEEIEKLKVLRAELDLQKQKLDLLIPTRNEIRANTGDTFDPILNNAEAARGRVQALQERLEALRNLAAIDVKLKIGAESFSKIMSMISVLSAASALNARGISLTDAINRLTKFAATIGNNWDLIFDQLSGNSEAGIAAIVGSLPSASQGGIQMSSRPSLAVLHGPEAIIPLNSPQARHMLGSGGGGMTVVNNFAGAVIMADDPVFLDDLSRKIEDRIVRRRR